VPVDERRSLQAAAARARRLLKELGLAVEMMEFAKSIPHVGRCGRGARLVEQVSRPSGDGFPSRSQDLILDRSHSLGRKRPWPGNPDPRSALARLILRNML
jgi:hypothetical protein